MSVAMPPRYRFQVRVSIDQGVNAMLLPSGEKDPNRKEDDGRPGILAFRRLS